MYRYVAFCWDRADSNAALEGARLTSLFRHRHDDWDVPMCSDGMTVYCNGSPDPGLRTYVLPAAGGTILGRIYRSGSTNQTASASEIDAAEIIRSGGINLVKEYWGSYVAILRSAHENAVIVVRDCSGRIPCYYYEQSGVRVFFADIRDVEPLGARFTISHLYLAAYILHAPLHIRQTGLREVSSLLAGDCVSISSSGLSHRVLWDPREIANNQIMEDFSRAKEELQFATEQAVHLWASAYDRILLKLSGGLDSAIVLGCLKRLGYSDRVACVTFYTENTDDDERAYAQDAADAAGVPHVEVARCSDATAFIGTLQSLPPESRPDFQKAIRALSLNCIRDLATRFRCNTVWTGQGGDHVFLNLRTAYPAVDYALQHRIPYRIPTILYESAILSGQSFWSVLAEAWRFYWHPDAKAPTPFDSSGASLMHPATVADVPDAYTEIPWRQSARRLPPGKQTQIDIFADLLNRHTPIGLLESPYECHPLVSQPLLEASLRIPTYHLLRGGRQRALARETFADCVPASILEREDKGTILDQVRTLLRGSGALLREILLDGTLVSLGIVDRARLERILVTQETYRASEIFPLLSCVAAEFWAKHWVDCGRQNASC